MSIKELYAAFQSVTVQELIDYLPQTVKEDADDIAVWYQLYYNGKGVKRVKAKGLKAAFNMLAGVPYNCDGDTLLSYYLAKLASSIISLDRCIDITKYSVSELLSKRKVKKNKRLLMKIIIKWIIKSITGDYWDIDQCNNVDIDILGPGIDAIFDFGNIEFDFTTFDPIVDFRLVSIQELIDYLPRLMITDPKGAEPEWYALKSDDKIVKRVKETSLAAAFKELATVEYRKDRTLVNYYYNPNKLDDIEFMLNNAITDEKFFEMPKDDDLIKKFILEWIISICDGKHTRTIYIERQVANPEPPTLNESVYTIFNSVTQEDLINYLPDVKLRFTDKNTPPVWYALMYKDEVIRRVKARSLAEAFQELAIAMLSSTRSIDDLDDDNTPIGYYYHAMRNNRDTIDQILCNKEMSQDEFFEMFNMNPSIVKQMILEWMIDECRENDIVHIKTLVLVDITTNAKINVEAQRPPSFDEFMAEVKRRALRKNNECYRIKENLYHLGYDYPCYYGAPINVAFRGNLWRALLDLDAYLIKETKCDWPPYHVKFLEPAYEYALSAAKDEERILTLDSLMSDVERWVFKNDHVFMLDKLSLL